PAYWSAARRRPGKKLRRAACRPSVVPVALLFSLRSLSQLLWTGLQLCSGRAYCATPRDSSSILSSVADRDHRRNRRSPQRGPENGYLTQQKDDDGGCNGRADAYTRHFELTGHPKIQVKGNKNSKKQPGS